jgi:hypothetical protein
MHAYGVRRGGELNGSRVWNPGRFEVRYVAGHHRKAVFERGGRDLKIGTVVTECSAQLSPATR